METVPVTGLEELDKHLDELVADPDVDLNAELFDHVELQLTGTIINNPMHSGAAKLDPADD